MIDYIRSFFGLPASANTRTVVGYHTPVDVKNVAYLKASKERLKVLLQLYKRYQHTLHAGKVEAVYTKTKEIHDYFVSRNRLHELELFHIQHTEHFINTFRVIKDAYDSRAGIPPAPEKAEIKPEESWNHAKVAERPKEHNGRRAAETRRTEIPEAHTIVKEASGETTSLFVPEVSINTFRKVPVVVNSQSELMPAAEIGFTSTEQEKEAFLAYVTARLGIEGMSYLGNAHVNISGSKSSRSGEFVPVIHWKGFLYALDLKDFRLFPVSLYRRGS